MDGEDEDENDSNNNDNSKAVTFLPATATISKQRKPAAAVDIRARGPQFGLVHWQRLVRSSKDLAQRKGAPYRKEIPWEEIQKHDNKLTPHDCWMVVRGIVYNIGPYLAYHPGGIEIFSRANVLGKDGTKLFDKYHRWVNIESLIGTLAIGTAAAAPVPDEEEKN